MPTPLSAKSTTPLKRVEWITILIVLGMLIAAGIPVWRARNAQTAPVSTAHSNPP